MRLKNLHIRNFRKIEELTVTFPAGLSVIVGENNTGKTAIIDALRFMLFPGRDFNALRLNEDDFRRGAGDAPIEISCVFCDLSDDDEVHFLECLKDIGDGNFEVWLNARAEFNTATRRVNYKMWGGETEGGTLPSNLYDKLNSIYLQPLRNPESGLKPGRYSQVARLIDCLTSDDKQGEFITIAKEANDGIRKLKSVKDAKSDIDTQMVSIAGEELSQKTELIFNDPTFHRIIAGLQPEIEQLPFALNGLGYNNLIFTAMTLGTLKRSDQYSFRSILVEEPEAHLHPQLQVLLLLHLVKETKAEGNQVQVIASTHSPILASQAPINSIIYVHENQNKVTTVSICSIEYDPILKNKLQRYLNATRAELFFARRILMVEGISEVLLMPVLARISGGNLNEAAVTVLNAEGINFNAFLPLFGNDHLNLPVAILTDGDDKERTGTPSATASGLKAKESEIANLRVEFGEITFEHELARSAALLPFMLEAYEELHPTNGAKLNTTVGGLKTDEEKAEAFRTEFLRNGTSKGKFAQELAGLLEDVDLTPDTVPQYIREAFLHLGVIKSEEPDEQNREASTTNPVSESD
ncbi:MAG: AAA family ATPase [Candidatus Hatepunaea meridiana]|nr:AAA family ATPase [Candidatus Hatepunaea meridiana]